MIMLQHIINAAKSLSSAECDAGRMKASPWQEVQVRVRQKAGLDG